MPQISIYVNQQEFEFIENGAKQSGKSVSKWVVERIMSELSPTYSQEFISLFGSVKDESFKRPDQLSESHDAKREEL